MKNGIELKLGSGGCARFAIKKDATFIGTYMVSDSELWSYKFNIHVSVGFGDEVNVHFPQKDLETQQLSVILVNQEPFSGKDLVVRWIKDRLEGFEEEFVPPSPLAPDFLSAAFH